MQVGALETVICEGHKVLEKDLNFVVEMLERQLLKLDGIKAEGEGKVQRKMEVTIINYPSFSSVFVIIYTLGSAALQLFELYMEVFIQASISQKRLLGGCEKCDNAPLLLHISY